MKSKNAKTIFSVSSILILLLAFILLPKDKFTKNNDANFQRPTTRTRYVPASSPSPDSAKARLAVSSQRPGRTLIIESVNFMDGGYVMVLDSNENLGRSEIQEGIVNDLEIALAKETTDGDIVTIVLFDEEDNEITRSEILITTTAMLPGIILPKDL